MFGFSLTKWHLDVVAEDGTALIVYSVRMSMGFLMAQGCAVLEFPADGTRGREWTSMKSGSDPVVDRDRLRWTNTASEVAGDWRRLSSPGQERMLGPKHGPTVSWCPVAARCSARVELPDGSIISGMGYAEKLRLTTPPWKLPINDLHWGRYLAEDHDVVWIRWEGDHPLTLVQVDGEVVPGAEVLDGAVRCADWQLALPVDQRRVLREGSLGKEALAKVPSALRGLIPVDDLLSAREIKWLQFATVSRPDGREVSRGWALYEHVRLKGLSAGPAPGTNQ
jgi:hypothetical protein